MTRRPHSQALPGSVVVITGAARGLGASLARRLAGRGARLALLGLEPDELGAVVEQVKLAGAPDADRWEVDVTDGDAMRAVADEVSGRFGRVDTVVANAGIATGGPLLVADAEAYDRVLEVNVLGSVRTARAFLPHLVRDRGYFLQIASLAAMMPTPLMSSYCASKSGVEAFAHALRGEVRHHGVDVGVAYLSWTDTDMVRGADRVPAMARMRSRLPWPFHHTYPLEPTVAHLADGIERRAAHVYGQPWLKVLQPVRWVFPAAVAMLPSGEIEAAEQEMRRDPSSTGLVGAGGAADRGRRASAG